MDKQRGRNPIINVLKTEWENLGKRKKTFVFYMSFFVIAGIISLMTHLVVGLIFNSIQTNGINSREALIKLIWLISLLLWVKIAFWIFHGIGRVYEQRTGFFVHRNYTNSKIKQILELPMKWHKDNHSGDTIDKINRARSSVENFSEDYTYNLVYILLNIFGSLVILFFVDVKIAAFAIIYSSIMLFGIMNTDKKLSKYFRELNEYSNKLSASVFDYLSNIFTVITLRLKKVVSREIDDKLTASYDTFNKTIIIDECKWAVGSIAIALMTVVVLCYKAYSDYITTGVVLIGTLYILFGYLRTVGDSFFQFGEFYGRLVRINSKIEGAYTIEDAYNKIEEKFSGELPFMWKNVSIKNLNFTYDVAGRTQHMKNVNLKFARGQKIALIGESGSGKSTMLALMRGLYKPDNGELYCDGKTLKRGFEKLTKNVTLIPQNPEIFKNTIKYNITLDLPAKKQDIEKVIGMAQFSKVIERLEKGLDTNVLEKGVALSGGEKQRLALARGLLAGKNSDIILLDEPTSSVDSVNEKKIHENIFEEFKDKTIISSIHRLHLLGDFDYIYMFEKGTIIAEGTFEELKQNPKFNDIWKKYSAIK